VRICSRTAGRPFANRVVETGDRDAALGVVHGREDPRERHRRVHDAAAIAAGVEVLRGSLHVDLEVREPAQRRQHARQPGREHRLNRR
jgi:hypothetical protein